MNIAILGAGAVGSVIGGYLARAGHGVTLLTVDQAHVDAVNTDGLKLTTPDGTETLRMPAMRPADCPPNQDLVILLTKTFQSADALAMIGPVVAAGVAVLTLQNGLGNTERVSEQVPADQVLFGTTMMSGHRVAPGQVENQGLSPTYYQGLTAAGDGRAAAMAAALADVDFTHDAETEVKVWQKAAFNCAMNATAGLAGARVGDIAAEPSAVAFVKRVADEVIDLAQTKGIGVERAAVHAMLEGALANHRKHVPSMTQDMAAGRATEIEALSGEIERQAEALGLAVPLNAALAALVRVKQAVVTKSR